MAQFEYGDYYIGMPLLAFPAVSLGVIVPFCSDRFKCSVQEPWVELFHCWKPSINR